MAPKRPAYGQVNLVISHARRKAIIAAVIAQRLREEKPPETLMIPKGADPNSQDIIVWPGVILTACLESVSKHGIYNSQLLRVVRWSAEGLELECTESAQRYTVPQNWGSLRHAASMCYAAVQGRSCTNQTVVLWDTTSKRFTRRHLVMGLSRASSVHDVWIGEA